MPYNLKIQRKLRNNRKKIGQCIYCNNEARENRVTCIDCGKKNAAASYKWRKKFAPIAEEFNICMTCTHRERIKGKKLCEICLTAKRLDDKARAAKKRLRRKLAGLCTRCGNPEKDANKAICEKCKVRMKEKKDINKENRKIKLRDRIRELNHLCKRCGEKLKNLHWKNCFSCRKKMAAHKVQEYHRKKERDALALIACKI